MKNFIKDYNPRHTEYQMENFIIKLNGKTVYGQYKQCLRELFSRYKALQELPSADTDTLREFKYFYGVAKKLRAQIYDPEQEIPAELTSKLESEYWVETFKHKLALELLTVGRPQIATLETILSMPERDEMMLFLDNMTAPGKAKEFIMNANYQTPKLSNPVLTDTEVLQLVGKGSETPCLKPILEDCITEEQTTQDSSLVKTNRKTR